MTRHFLTGLVLIGLTLGGGFFFLTFNASQKAAEEIRQIEVIIDSVKVCSRCHKAKGYRIGVTTDHFIVGTNIRGDVVIYRRDFK